MCRRITNCIQNIWIESGNKIIFGTNIHSFQIHWLIKYFYISTHQNQNHSDPRGSNSSIIHKFIISKWRLI